MSECLGHIPSTGKDRRNGANGAILAMLYQVHSRFFASGMGRKRIAFRTRGESRIFTGKRRLTSQSPYSSRIEVPGQRIPTGRQRSASVSPASRMMLRCVLGLRSALPWTGTEVLRPESGCR